MVDQLTLQIKNTFEAIPPANDTASAWLAERGAPAEIQYFTNLAIEEFATNCIKYGYDDTKEHFIEVSLSLFKGELLMVITDDGHPFDPLAAPEPQLDLPAEERSIGGLGIYLVRKMSDRMEYKREGNKNRLKLRKEFRRPKATKPDALGS
ncbi:MAG TPA: ATP-binding protein [Candidatus Limnocylindrales bacterium]|nr:ATP-binding protein [Candidatus Limnocylindrales bacterium]